MLVKYFFATPRIYMVIILARCPPIRAFWGVVGGEGGCVVRQEKDHTGIKVKAKRIPLGWVVKSPNDRDVRVFSLKTFGMNFQPIGAKATKMWRRMYGRYDADETAV
jgi:hypothetical protein